jgi:hypothetical protein
MLLITWQLLRWVVGMVIVQPLCAAAGTRLGNLVPLGKRAEAGEWCIGEMGEVNLKVCCEDDMVRQG